MKQTVEEAAKEYIYKARASFVGITPEEYEEQINPEYPYNVGTDEDFESLFIAGADWQAKQSPWISVKDKAGCDTSDDCIVMVMNGDIFKAYFSSENKWMKSDGGYYDEVVDDVVAWLPIPSFDEILEANKDVLERIKEKGD